MMRGDGLCCCAISSGGTQLKSSGRVGHAALVGAGGCARTFGTCSATACCTGTGEDVSERYLAYRVVDGVARDGPEDWMELSAECFEVSRARTAHLGCIGLHKSKDEQRKQFCQTWYFIDLIAFMTSGCRVFLAHTTPAMAVCWGSNNGMQANFVSKKRNGKNNPQDTHVVCQCSVLK